MVWSVDYPTYRKGKGGGVAVVVDVSGETKTIEEE